MAPDDPSPLAAFGDIPRALEHLRLPAFAIRRDGRIVWLNAAARDLVGDAVGLPYGRVVAPESRPVAADELARKIIGGVEASEYAAVVLRPDGARVPVEISSVAVADEGTVAGVFGVAQIEDIPARPKDDDHLSPRQAQVLGLLAHGATTAQMAEELGVAEDTLRNHVRQLLRRLGVHSRLAAVVEGRRRGLL
jgi:PAS domain S-box-containing protein